MLIEQDVSLESAGRYDVDSNRPAPPPPSCKRQDVYVTNHTDRSGTMKLQHTQLSGKGAPLVGLAI